MSRQNLKAVLGDLEPFKKEKKIKVTTDKDLEKTIERLFAGYAEARKIDWYKDFSPDVESVAIECIPDITKLKITPLVIGEFVSRISPDDAKDKYKLSQYISALIKFSYSAGHNNFQVFVRHLGNFFVGHNIIGNPARPLKIEVFGDLGDSGFSDTKCTAITVHGNTGTNFADTAYYSSFDVRGNMEKNTGRFSRHCTFKNHSKEALDTIKEDAADYVNGKRVHNSGNKYYLLKDGKEVQMFTKEEK